MNWNGTEIFERHIVLRGARYIYLALAATASLGVVGAAMVLAYGLSPIVPGFDPQPPSPPEEVVPSSSDIHLTTATQPSYTGSTSQPLPMPMPSTQPSTQGNGAAATQERDRLWASLRASFDTSTQPWLDTTTTECIQRDWYGRCRRSNTEITSVGLAKQLQNATRPLSLSDEIAVLTAISHLLSQSPNTPGVRYALVTAGIAMGEVWGGEAIAPAESLVTSAAQMADSPPPPAWPQRAELATLVGSLKLQNSQPEQFVAWMEHVAVQLLSLPDASQEAATRESWAIVSSFQTKSEEAATAIEDRLTQESPSNALAFLRAYREAVDAAQRDARREAEADRYAYATAVTEREIGVAAAQAKRWAARKAGLMALPISLALLALLGIGIAVLAVERNTRAIRALASVPSK